MKRKGAIAKNPLTPKFMRMPIDGTEKRQKLIAAVLCVHTHTHTGTFYT